jgi:hypothetical protein
VGERRASRRSLGEFGRFPGLIPGGRAKSWSEFGESGEIEYSLEVFLCVSGFSGVGLGAFLRFASDSELLGAFSLSARRLSAREDGDVGLLMWS